MNGWVVPPPSGVDPGPVWRTSPRLALSAGARERVEIRIPGPAFVYDPVVEAFGACTVLRVVSGERSIYMNPLPVGNRNAEAWTAWDASVLAARMHATREREFTMFAEVLGALAGAHVRTEGFPGVVQDRANFEQRVYQLAGPAPRSIGWEILADEVVAVELFNESEAEALVVVSVASRRFSTGNK